MFPDTKTTAEARKGRQLTLSMLLLVTTAACVLLALARRFGISTMAEGLVWGTLIGALLGLAYSFLKTGSFDRKVQSQPVILGGVIGSCLGVAGLLLFGSLDFWAIEASIKLAVTLVCCAAIISVFRRRAPRRSDSLAQQKKDPTE